MANWSESMQQTFEFYTVDPGTWEDMELIDNVKSCTISRDSTVETLGSATFDITNLVGECYIRVYLIAIQNGVREKYPLGTFLVQTPSSSFDGKIRTVSMDAYTPLIELKETQPPIGYYIPKKQNIMENAYKLTMEHLRAPVVRPESSDTLERDFIADPSENWISFLIDLTAKAKYEYGLDEMGRILFQPKQDTASLQPVWIYNDDNKSILYHEISMDHDLYDIPNVVELVYTTNDSNSHIIKVVNKDPNSPLSIVNRGREICHRVTNPELSGNPTEEQYKEYAERLLKEMSTIEYTISYTHGYNPVRLGDCVLINYERAGLTNIKAKVISQSIKCEPGCPVSEKAVFTTKLWG